MMSAGPTPQDAELLQDSFLQEYSESNYSVCPDQDNHASSRLRFSPPPAPNPNSDNDTFLGPPPEWKLSGDLTGLGSDQESNDLSDTGKIKLKRSSFESLLRIPNDDDNEDLGRDCKFKSSAVYQNQEEQPNNCSAPYLAPLESGVFPSNHFDSFTSETTDDWQEQIIDPASPSKSLLSTPRAHPRPCSQPNGVSLLNMPSQTGLQGLGLAMNDTGPILASESVDDITNRVDSISVEFPKPARRAFGPINQRQYHDSRSNHATSMTKANAGTTQKSNLLSKTPAIYTSQYEEKLFTPNRQTHDRNASVPNSRPRTGVTAPRPSHDLPEVTSDHSLHVLKDKHSKAQSPSIYLR